MTKTAKLMAMLPLVLVLVAVFEAPAWATFCDFAPWLCQNGGPSPSPEIDPNLLRGTLTLLAGGVLMLAGRVRRR